MRRLADKNFQMLKHHPYQPSLHFKRIDQVCLVRVGAHHRALGMDAAIQSFSFLDWFVQLNHHSIRFPIHDQVVQSLRRRRDRHKAVLATTSLIVTRHTLVFA